MEDYYKLIYIDVNERIERLEDIYIVLTILCYALMSNYFVYPNRKVIEIYPPYIKTIVNPDLQCGQPHNDRSVALTNCLYGSGLPFPALFPIISIKVMLPFKRQFLIIFRQPLMALTIYHNTPTQC